MAPEDRISDGRDAARSSAGRAEEAASGAERPEADAPSSGRRHVFDNPRNVRRVILYLLLACGAVFALDLVNLVQGWLDWPELRHRERSWEGLPGFYAAYGFVACVLLVLAAKEMRKFLMRDEDYYDR